MVQKLIDLIRLIRPTHWVKNTFVLAPLIFIGKFDEVAYLSNALLTFCFFSLASSSAYIINDCCDIESDRKHPLKRTKRPLASGRVSKKSAVIMLFVLCGPLSLAYFYNPAVMAVIAGYLLINIFYSFILKHHPVIDIFTIAAGFVLRVYAGALALSVALSSWMLITTLCLALFLASLKRRQEMAQADSRKVLRHYSVPLMNRYAEISMTGTLVFYSLFVITVRPDLVTTIFLVLYGLFRYYFLIDTQKKESPTDILLSDWQLLLTTVSWAILCIAISRQSAI